VVTSPARSKRSSPKWECPRNGRRRCRDARKAILDELAAADPPRGEVDRQALQSAGRGGLHGRSPIVANNGTRIIALQAPVGELGGNRWMRFPSDPGAAYAILAPSGNPRLDGSRPFQLRHDLPELIA